MREDHRERAGKDGKVFFKLVKYINGILSIPSRTSEWSFDVHKIKPIRQNFTSFLTFIQLFADVIIRKIRYSILSKYLKTLSSLIITSKIRKVKNVRKILNFVSAKL